MKELMILPGAVLKAVTQTKIRTVAMVSAKVAIHMVAMTVLILVIVV